MNIDPSDIKKLASNVDSEDGDSLADLFLSLLEMEHNARHQKKPLLIKKFTQKIDEELGE